MTAALAFCEIFHLGGVRAEGAEAGRLAEIGARGELRVCIWPDYFAMSWRSPRTGTLEGMDIDMAEALARRLRVRLRFVETSFAEFAERLDQGDCDLAMMGVGITPEREKRVDFSQPYLASPVYAVTPRSSARVRQWSDLDRPGNVIAVVAGTRMEPLMRETLRHADLLVLRSPLSREQEVLAGRADAFMSDYPYTRRVLQAQDWARVIEPPGAFGNSLYAYAVRKGDRAWLAEVNAFLAAARADGTLAAAARRHGLTPVLVE
ncbi:amino acid ABC transporter substrate-binding protein [Roseomonas ludipueritiae]|uniref:Amino acid ABC transporter substrate-binding protein n=2 Tax=Pseudoroseomonas ludipueritiae TaxID=198093 RepID=A0ABR7RBY9_9PROT|nr:amino acid ABC transporter substrate-binding protein [Pseudoroseomonas ludipueritiae]